MLDRRAFLTAILAGPVMAALARPGHARATPVEDLMLNRLTFGATAATRRDLARLGPQAWLDAQLALPAHDPALDARLAAARLRIAYEAGDIDTGRWDAVDELRPLSALTADPASLLPLLDWSQAMDYAERSRPGEEVIAASLIRAVHAPAQLREVMTQFWHDHFNVHARKDEYVSVFFPAYDAGLRQHALGNFRALLGHVATSPSMLVYLTNDESRASPANENFARELLELHTLGAGVYWNDRYRDWRDVPGAGDGLAQGYIDDDVWEVARCFTGWTVGDGRWVAEGRTTPRTGRFAYVESWHDPYQKRVLGREFPAHAAPMADGNAVLDMLATHPATARFVCGKIARRLLQDDPDPALVGRLADLFLAQSGAADQIAQVIRALVADPAFAATPPSKLRRPFEFLAALLRATGAEVAAPDIGWHWQLSRAGWMQHCYPPPTGHPDRTEDWATGVVLLRLAEVALDAHEPWAEWVQGRLSDHLPEAPLSVRDMAAHWGQALVGVPLDGNVLAVAGVDPDWVPETAEDRAGISAAMVAAAALGPEFLFR